MSQIRKIQIKKYEETINTNTYILTFSTHRIPKEIKIGYQKINIESHIPNPLRRYKCQRFGHHQDQCTRPPVCGRCGEYDIHKDCQRVYKCANYPGNHSPGSKDCEIWKKEKEITRIKHTKNNISRSEKNDRKNKIRRKDKKEYLYHQQRKLSYVRNGNNHKTWCSCPTCKRNEGTDTRNENYYKSSHRK